LPVGCRGAADGVQKEEEADGRGVVVEWERPWHALLCSFGAAFLYALVAGQVPWLLSFPVLSWLGLGSATAWGWELTLSTGYVGQGMIMGPRTVLSMLAGALLGAAKCPFPPPLEVARVVGGQAVHRSDAQTVARAQTPLGVSSLRRRCRKQSGVAAGLGAGWAALGPYAAWKGWAPGDVADWETGAAGWVLWVSLAVMLGDSIASLSLLLVNAVQKRARRRWCGSPPPSHKLHSGRSRPGLRFSVFRPSESPWHRRAWQQVFLERMICLGAHGHRRRGQASQTTASGVA
jgi:OPT oligopeptide transporter protein